MEAMNFFKDDETLYETCLSKREEINTLLKPIFKADVFSLRKTNFNLKTSKNSMCSIHLKDKLIRAK